MKKIGIVLSAFLLLGAFIAGRETTPPSYIEVGSFSQLYGTTFVNTQLRIIGQHNVDVEGAGYVRDVPWWRKIYYHFSGYPGCLEVNGRDAPSCSYDSNEDKPITRPM